MNLISKHYSVKSPILKFIPCKKYSSNNLFLPSFCISIIFIDLSLQPITKLLLRMVPAFPFSSYIEAFHILYLFFLYSNHAPGFGFKPLIFPIIFFALSSQFIFPSLFLIFFAYVAFLWSCSINLSFF